MAIYYTLQNAVSIVAYVLLAIRALILFSISFILSLALFGQYDLYSENFYNYADDELLDVSYNHVAKRFRLYIIFSIYFGFTTFFTILLVKGFKDRKQQYLLPYIIMDSVMAVVLTIVSVYLVINKSFDLYIIALYILTCGE